MTASVVLCLPANTTVMAGGKRQLAALLADAASLTCPYASVTVDCYLNCQLSLDGCRRRMEMLRTADTWRWSQRA